MDGMQYRAGQDTTSYHTENGIRTIELVAAHNIEYGYTHGGKSLAIGELNAPKRLKPPDATFTYVTWPTKPNVKLASDFDQDDMISDKVAKKHREKSR